MAQLPAGVQRGGGRQGQSRMCLLSGLGYYYCVRHGFGIYPHPGYQKEKSGVYIGLCCRSCCLMAWVGIVKRGEHAG